VHQDAHFSCGTRVDFGPVRERLKASRSASPSGKTLVVASTRGNQKTAVQIDGKDLYLGVNAYVYAEAKGTK